MLHSRRGDPQLFLTIPQAGHAARLVNTLSAAE
jgi:hypothetical protein